MKISLNAIKEIYKQTGVDNFLPNDTDKVTEKIGAQLGEIEEIIDLGKKYEGAIVVKVVSCINHPNADKLKICTIDDGSKNKKVKRDQDGLIQIVCGAPNVKAGMLAVWLPPGVTVPATYDKEPLVLEAREIRGQVSNGMLASANELGISDDHGGILEVDKQAGLGDSFAGLYKLDDYIIDIENKMFTHRPDCFGLLGIARELAGIYGKEFKSPDWYQQEPKSPKPEKDELKLEVINEIPELAPRFCAVALSNVKVAPSPVWLQVFLSKAGIKSINNVVDYTNFMMYFSGQPLHAYDYDKVSKLSGNHTTLKIRLSRSNENIKLLNGKEITPAKDTIMIATDKHPIGIGGVIGGSSTEVDNSTKNIIIECANFDPYSIRRTSMAHGIFTDAVTRFTKGQSSLQNLAVINKAVSDLQYLTGGKLASKVQDLQSNLPISKPIKVSAAFINERLGLQLKAKEIAEILENVEIDAKLNGDNLEVIPLFWRTDIEIPEDVVEEVGRLYGYDRLPLILPRKTMAPSVVSEELKLKHQLRETLSSLGANEVLSYSFVHSKLLEAVGEDEEKSFKLKNALSPELQYYRQSLTPSLLEKVHPNIKLGFDSFVLFELGKVHIKGKSNDGLPDEFDRVALVAAHKNQKSVGYYTARKYLLELLDSLGVGPSNIEFKNLEDQGYYLAGRSAKVCIDGKPAGVIGEYTQSTVSKLKLPDFCAGFELDLKSLSALANKPEYKPISRYPSLSQDITLQTDHGVSFADIKNLLSDALNKNSSDDMEFEIEDLAIYAKDEKHKNISFRINVTSYHRTLTTEVVNALMDKAYTTLKSNIKTKRV